jgi:hypothetical protein
MGPATVPTEPVTWTAEHIDPLSTIPPEVRELYRQEWCSALTASDVLGYRRKFANGHEEASGAVTRMCARYRDRMDARTLHTMEEARPRPNELVARKGTLETGGHGWLVHTGWLISRMYPQVPQPW